MKVHESATLVPMGLAGGQGKTTVALMTGRILAKLGIPVLFVDADPQASLTAFLGVELTDRPTLLEILTKPADKVPLYTAIHEVPETENLFLIPANDELEGANHSLAASGMSISVLRKRLYQVDEKVSNDEKISTNFGLIIIDPPPERSHLALTALGCADYWVIPAEANIKGVKSLQRTKELVESCSSMVPNAELIGAIPFRAKWVGLNPTATTKETIDVMRVIVGNDKVLPHILESDIYKRAINDQVLPSALGKPDLEYPINCLIDLLKSRFGPFTSKVSEYGSLAA
jgi:chromosome partitioning protein